MHQPAPAWAAHACIIQRLQQPLLACPCRQQLADQRDAQPLARSIQQLPGLGEIHALAALAHVRAALYLPLAPVHLALAMQGQALLHGRGEQGRMAGRIETVLQQHPMLALRL
ncbi:hypothetical protein G6F22_007842 [Rhizopus arrhizus]|nr:hypothetical protein G6F22_007842 [Rhizopus arrhizus]